MKKFAVFTFFAFFVLISVSAKKDEPKKDTYDYDNLVTSVRGVRSPLISDEYILFTAEKNARNVGISAKFTHFRCASFSTTKSNRQIHGIFTS